MEINACVFINRNEETKEGGMNWISKPVIDDFTIFFKFNIGILLHK